MKRIYKYMILSGGIVYVPKGAKVLDVQVQRNELCFWAEVDPEAEPEERRFEVIGTGWDMQEPVGRYIGTVQTDGGTFVWHIYEKE